MIAYALTDPSTLSFDSLHSDLGRFATRADWIVYRDRAAPHYRRNAIAFLRATEPLGFGRRLLHGDPVAAHELGADGVHLRSDQLESIISAKAMGLFVVVSTHAIEEIQSSESFGADAVTYSPIFSSPGKGDPIGLVALERAVQYAGIPIIALGGIVTQEQVRACRDAGAAGFASIRYFA